MKTIQSHAGLYMDKAAHPEFTRTVLVTAANVAYTEMLKNWRCHADRLGLDYIIVAFDKAMYEKLDPERSILVDGHQTSHEEGFRTKGFNVMTCNKIKMVQEILHDTGLNVVFSDPDNVFKHDPFANGVDLGEKIRSKKYQFIYQQNQQNKPSRSDAESPKKSPNTGFYFASAERKPLGVQAMWGAGLKECHKHQEIDDQTNFNHALKNVANGKGKKSYGRDIGACTNYCGHGSKCGEDSFDLCAMDPISHATGWRHTEGPDPEILTFHANYASGIVKKVAKLQKMGFWDPHCELQ